MPSRDVWSPPLIDVSDVHLVDLGRSRGRCCAHRRDAGKMPVSNERTMPRAPPGTENRHRPERPPGPRPRMPPSVAITEAKAPGHGIPVPHRADPWPIVVARPVHHGVVSGDVRAYVPRGVSDR